MTEKVKKVSLTNRPSGHVADLLAKLMFVSLSFLGSVEERLAAGSAYSIVSTNCNGPVPDQTVEQDTFVWQDCSGGWHVRAGWLRRDGDSRIIGTIGSSLGFDSFNGYDLEANDQDGFTNIEEWLNGTSP